MRPSSRAAAGTVVPSAENSSRAAATERASTSAMSLPPKVLEHVGAEAPALALLARGLDGLHDPELGVDGPGAPAHRAGPFGVVREQGGLDPVGLGERLADGLEQTGVRGGVRAARA